MHKRLANNFLKHSIMYTIPKLTLLFATVALATAVGAQTVDNWQAADNQLVWKNGTNELCWRDANWTPATAAPGCDGALAAAVPIPVPPKSAMPAVETVSSSQPPKLPTAPTINKMVFAAEAFFDFDKSVLKPKGREQLNLVVENAKTLDLEVVVVMGHTDSIGSESYNQQLSMRRSETVKAYLVSKGIDKTKVFVEAKGETLPVTDNTTPNGRAINRRVEIEVVGSRVGR